MRERVRGRYRGPTETAVETADETGVALTDTAPVAPDTGGLGAEGSLEGSVGGSPQRSSDASGYLAGSVLQEISTSNDEVALRALIAAARARLARIGRASVVEVRPFRSGLLSLEWRSHKAGGTRRGPYWYYRYREDGRQRWLYLGKTEDPEASAAEKLDERT